MLQTVCGDEAVYLNGLKILKKGMRIFRLIKRVGVQPLKMDTHSNVREMVTQHHTNYSNPVLLISTMKLVVSCSSISSWLVLVHHTLCPVTGHTPSSEIPSATCFIRIIVVRTHQPLDT
jgi:hypothetical protein